MPTFELPELTLLISEVKNLREEVGQLYAIMKAREEREAEVYYTVKQVGEQYGVSKQTVYSWFQKGLNYEKVGGRVRIPSTALDSFKLKGMGLKRKLDSLKR